MKNSIRVFCGFITLCYACTATGAEPGTFKGLDVYISRHAETMGNVTGDYSHENQCTFSPLGKEQIAGIAEKFMPYDFDAILVSPTYRTQHTILPYLKASGKTGEIWQEVEEIDCGANKVPPDFDIPLGRFVEIIPEGEDELVLRDPSFTRRYEPDTKEQVIGQLTKGRDMIVERFGNTGQKVVVMCHSCTGARLLEIFLGLEVKGRFAPKNASLSLLRQNPDGSFRMMSYNDEPCEQEMYWTFSDLHEDEAKPVMQAFLQPKRFLNPPTTGYRVQWAIEKPDGTILFANETAVTPIDKEKNLASLTIPIENPPYGQVWTIKSALFDGDTLVSEWEQPLLIPSSMRLEGRWLIKAGDDPSWSKAVMPDEDWDFTQVPGGWENDALPDYDGIAWYRKTFVVPNTCLEKWEDQPLAIAIGAIDDADETFLNGTRIGATGEFPPVKTTAWDEPRLYPIDRDLLREDNVIAVRVSDWMGGGGLWRGPVAIGPKEELKEALRLSAE
ncbi:MAG: hypothetical protein EOM20_19510 [Spartobacteria bacterium]|nr:hypothetical protein [Spartobacteria bacterium]